MEIEKLRDQYYESISLLQNEKDIIDALPINTCVSFYTLMYGIIKRLKEDVDFYSEMLSDLDRESEDYQFTLDMLANTKFKVECCTKKIETAEKQEITDIMQSDKKINFVFAKSSIGEGIRIINDLKGVPQERYTEIYEFLEMIYNRQNFDNPSKIKKIRNNDNLVDVWEAKPFKVRIVFKFLDGDTVYIFIIKEKKSNNDSIDISQIVDRFKSCDGEFKWLKEFVKDGKKKEELIQEHLKYKEELYDYLKQNARGNKKVGR